MQLNFKKNVKVMHIGNKQLRDLDAGTYEFEETYNPYGPEPGFGPWLRLKGTQLGASRSYLIQQSRQP